MVSKTSRERKKYSRPSSSPGLGWRVVAETEKRMVRSHDINRRASVDLPAPEGEERISKSPRRIDLFHVLNLFAHLVYHRLKVKPDAGQGKRLRFGTERIGLAHEFLHQEIEFAAHGGGFCQKQTGGIDMGRKAVEFFGHVVFHRDQRKFLREARFVHTL